MKNEMTYFEEAISLGTYMDKMEVHKENSFGIYEQFNCPEDDEFIDVLKEKKPRILVITEDWCSDAMLNNPVLRKIGEAANLDIRAVYRDENLDLIDRHLTEGKRSIPIYLMLDRQGEVLAKWGPRAASLQQYVKALHEALPSAGTPDYEQKKQELLDRLAAEYATKPEHWLAVYEDIRQTFLPVIQKVS